MSDETITYGANGRPLSTERDHQAEAVRDVLRSVGCQEWSDGGGDELAAGFVVESEDPFQVACAGAGTSTGLNEKAEEHRYRAALDTAGYRVAADPDGYGLQVWLPA